MDRQVAAVIDQVLLLNVTFYSNDETEASVKWYRINNLSSTPLHSGRQRYNYTITEKNVDVMFRTISVLLPGHLSQLAISPVQTVDFTVFEVKVINNVGSAVSSVAVVPKGENMYIILLQ